MVVSTIKKIKDFVDPALDAVKKNMDLEGMQEFATTVKRGKDKTYRPEKTIVRPSEEVEESLAEKLSRATNKELTIDDKKATTIMPAPGKFFNQQSKDFKPPIDKMAREALVEGDPDPIFGMYIDVNAVKNATEKVYQNLFVSGRTAQKSEGLKFDKGKQKFIEYSKAKASPPVSRALSYDGPELLDSSKLKGLEEKERNQVVIDQMKKNFELNTGEKGKEININLLQPDRFSVIIDGNKNRLDHPIVAVHYPTKTKDGHYYTLDTQLVGPVYMKRNTIRDTRTNKAQSPNLKPATVGNIETGLGKQIGVIRIAKRKTKEDPSGYTDHPLYDYIEVDGTAASSPDAPMSLESKFNQGGAVPMQRQMEMFNDGGLKEEGGTKDPVSGNDVPSGSLQEEVRDDIDAKLSPGEFVFPADVVRFIGLEKLMLMRDKAKKGLARMEEMGQMGNSEEATIDDDVPFGMEDLIIVAGPPDNEMSVGGMPSQQQQSNQAGGVPGQGRFEQIVGQPMFESTTKVFKNDQNQVLYIPFVRGQPVYQPPPGYREVTQEEQQQEATTANVESARVDPVTETGSGELGGGPDASDMSVGEMSPTQQADLGQFNKDNPTIANISEFIGNTFDASMKTGFGAPAVSQVAGVVGAVMSMDDDASLAQMAKSAAVAASPFGAFTGVKGIGTTSNELAEKMREMREKDPTAFAKAQQEFAKDLVDNIDKSLAGYENATVNAAKDVSFGASPAQMSAHAEGVGRGDRPQGSSPTSTGGYTTVGPTSPYGASYELNPFTNEYEVVKEATERDIEISRENERQKELRGMGSFGGMAAPSDPGIGAAGEPEGNPSGGGSEGAEAQGGVAGGPQGGPQSEAEASGQSETVGAGTFKGGFIPKRKKQKKMKRGGLASR